MDSHTMKAKCPKCNGDDCNYTVTSGEIASFKLVADEEFCNSCGYYSKRLSVDGNVVIPQHEVKKEGG